MEEIARVLPTLLQSHLRRSQPRVIEILAPLWPRIAGKPMAQHSRPVAFFDGTLTLESDCASWTAELRAMAEEIRAEINAFLGQPVVKKLRVRCSPPDPGRGAARIRESRHGTD